MSGLLAMFQSPRESLAQVGERAGVAASHGRRAHALAGRDLLGRPALDAAQKNDRARLGAQAQHELLQEPDLDRIAADGRDQVLLLETAHKTQTVPAPLVARLVARDLEEPGNEPRRVGEPRQARPGPTRQAVSPISRLRNRILTSPWNAGRRSNSTISANTRSR